MDIKKLIKLDKTIIEKIQTVAPIKVFQTNSPLFYEGQTPIVAYLIVDGSVNLIKNKKIKTTLRNGSLIGVKELMSHSPSSVSAEAMAHTKVCFLDKSTIKEIIQTQSSELSMLFQNICEFKIS